MYAAMERDGVSARMRQLIHARLHTAMKKAARWKLIRHNFMVDVDRPTATGKAFTVLHPDDVGRLLAAAKGDRLYALYVLAVTTGLRQGELLGLQADDVDLGMETIFVRGQLQEVAGDLTLVEPKTKAGRRRVHLPKIAVKALREHFEKLRDEKYEGSFVFPATNGARMRKSSLRRHSFEKLLKKAGLPHIRFHDLRHTAATLLLREDVHPKIVQERLGHARIAITLDTYSHVLPSMQQEAAARLDRMFATLDVRVRLQFGYSTPDEGQEDEKSDDANVVELQEKKEWSHVDSNHGPPACEAGALTN